jgi:CDP-diacylglycerol--glycerol-3-phosphate 3-phosphatidyltransferase
MAAAGGQRPGLTWPQYVAAWSALHGGFDPDAATPVVRGWIRLAYRGGGLLARAGIGPAAVTGCGLLLCLAVPFAALLGGGGLLLGALLVLLAALADALDGAVAVVAGRTSRLGFVYDSVADRLGEPAWLAAFWVVGTPGWLVAAGAAISWLHEYVRARAAAGGMTGLGAVTVGERPTRVAVAITGLLVAGLAGLVRPGWESGVALVAALCWVVLGLIGLAQLTVAVRRALTA